MTSESNIQSAEAAPATPAPRRRWLRVLLWLFIAPFILFTTLMVLLYVPPVQNFIRERATAAASEATGWDIRVERIDLRFPLNLLVRGVEVVDRPDTLLQLGTLNVRVQAWPLVHGRVEVDEVSLRRVKLNSASLIEGTQVKGELGSFFLQSHGVDLQREEVTLNRIELADTRLQVALTDTTAASEDTTATAPIPWKIKLNNLKLSNLVAEVQMPLDSMCVAANIPEAELTDASADLLRSAFGCRQFRLAEGLLHYDVGALPSDSVRHRRFDASHLALRDVNVGIDSVRYDGRNINAVIRELRLTDMSGLSVSSLTGSLHADSVAIRVPQLRLLTPHSELNLTAQTYWQLVEMPTTGHLSARFDARLGKQDILLLAGDLPESFRQAYPMHPLVLKAGTEGNLREMQISRFSIDLPGAFSMQGGGEFYHLSDSIRRSGSMDLQMQTGNLNFLTAMGGTAPTPDLVIPDSMALDARFAMDGPQLTATLGLAEQQGRLHLDAAYHLGTEAYRAHLDVDSLQLDHFMPRDSLRLLSLRAEAAGQGTDPASPLTTAALDASLRRLEYARWTVSGVDVKASLARALAKAHVVSDNALLKMEAVGTMRLDTRHTDGHLQLRADDVALHRLGITPEPLPNPCAFTLSAAARHDSVHLSFDSGDLHARLKGGHSVEALISQSSRFASLLMEQTDRRRLDHATLRRALPAAGMEVEMRGKNPVAELMAAQGIRFSDFRLGFGFTPETGINGRTDLHGLRMDSVQIDSIFFTVHQDTTRMKLQGGVVNGPRNPQVTFRSTLTGEIRNEEAGLTLDFTDAQGRTGVLFGVNARPLTEGHGKGNGVLLTLTPEEPVIAFRKFRFVDRQNWIYLHKNMRVYAGIDMDSDDGLCFKMQSNRADTVSLQNINVELSRLDLGNLSSVLPYMPHLGGLFTVDANYVQTATTLQVSAEAGIDSLTYERRPVGNIGLGATWLPTDRNEHYINAYLSHNHRQVMSADGILRRDDSGGEHSAIEMTTALEQFPLDMLNAFVPGGAVRMGGELDGELTVDGTTEKPLLNGSLALDSVQVRAPQMGAHYWFDNRPVQIVGNQLRFDKFAIYTTSKNPFTIDGTVDFRNMQRPTANLHLLAHNYTLLSAPRTRESLIYGKVFVDIDARVRGPLDGLTMRGSMNLLGNTNVTYVLTDSPLTVEDRLDGLVTFTLFADTTQTQQEVPTMSLGGLQMYMSMHIDDAVRLRADLSPDRSKFIELEGGGDLNLQYTPQGDMSLTGRYTLSGGTMKYSIPVIPLKEFSINPGSYVDWRGDIMNPTLDLKATERMRSSVSDGGDDSQSRMVNFNVSVGIKNRLSAPELQFDLEAPEDATIANELQTLSVDERNKLAITMLATGIYLGNSAGSGGGGLTMSSALNSVLQRQINALAGSARNASISVGIEDRTSAETGDTQKDFSFRYSQRFFNDRVQIIIGGKVSTGANATNSAESFIDNVSLEYRLDPSGTRYVRAFYKKNYESVLDGEITETGAGIVMRKKMDRLGELFIFKRKKP